MNKNQLLTVLKINGLSENSPENDIRNVLKSAQYTESEVESALYILNSTQTVRNTRVDGLHTVFYSDSTLRPNQVAGLLGIDTKVDAPISPHSRKSAMGFSDVLLIVGLSVVFAFIGIFLYMYLSKVGLFHSAL